MRNTFKNNLNLFSYIKETVLFIGILALIIVITSILTFILNESASLLVKKTSEIIEIILNGYGVITMIYLLILATCINYQRINTYQIYLNSINKVINIFVFVLMYFSLVVFISQN